MQSVKRLDSVRQFCEVLLYGDGNGGADFTEIRAYFQPCERFVSPCKEYGNGSPFLSIHYSMDTAISGVSVYYGYTTIIIGDNRYIVVPQAVSSGKSIVL